MARDVMLEAYAKADAILREARAGLLRFGVDVPDVSVPLYGFRDGYGLSSLIDDQHQRGDLAHELDRLTWAALLAKTHVDQLMDKRTRDEFRKKIHEQNHHTPTADRLPALTPENIEGLFAGLHQRRAEFFGNAVESVFRSLSWDYKTNTPMRFGEKMIVSSAYSHFGWYGHLDCDRLDDLERVLLLLDRQPPATYETGLRGMSGLEFGHWYDAPPTDPEKASVLRFKIFQNRNAHVRVRTDLVDRMNEIMAARHPFGLPVSRTA